MDGPFSLNCETIDREVTCTKPGNYALGYLNDKGVFIVKYVGRADSDVNGRLKAHVTEGYPLFKFKYATSPKAAYEKECKNFHDFGGDKGRLDNKIHPDLPNESKNWKCPICDKQE